MSVAAMGIQIDLFAVIVLLVIYYKNVSKTNKESDRLFDGIIFSLIASLLLDVAIFIFNGKSIELNLTASLLYYISTPVSGFMAILYLEYKMEQSVRAIKRVIISALPFFAVYVLICVLDIWNNRIFYIDNNALYHRGRYFWISEILCLYFLAIPVFKACRIAKRVKDPETRKVYINMAVLLMPTFVGALLQYLFYGVSTNWLGAVISVLIMFLNLQNAEITTDSLTGINNRRVLYRYLGGKTSYLAHGERLFVYVIDADNFKNINDTYGHAAGDNALKNTARIIKNVCRENDDFMARMGGDEFAVVCIRKKTDSEPDITAALEKETKDFNKRKESSYKLSLSAGCAEFGLSDTMTVDAVIKKADDRMYHVKRAKKEALECL